LLNEYDSYKLNVSITLAYSIFF